MPGSINTIIYIFQKVAKDFHTEREQYIAAYKKEAKVMTGEKSSLVIEIQSHMLHGFTT